MAKEPKNSITEGDVEARYILPFLTGSSGLGVPLDQVHSKKTIVHEEIGKGPSKKIYIPDFLIYKKSLPICVVEAKKPGINLMQAYAEAKLYAHVLNSRFPSDVNPCCRIIACDGEKILIGPWDAIPTIDTNLSLLTIGTHDFAKAMAYLGDTQLDEIATNFSSSMRSSKFRRPFNQGAGPVQLNSKVQPNTFAADLTPVLRRYFSSRDQSVDEQIYERAYISSDEVTGYDRILESFLKDRIARFKGMTQITTTKRKADVFSKVISNFNRDKPVSGDLQLITGGVGAGKSLFARRYKEFLQPNHMRTVNHWAFINFNDAPPDVAQWETWVYESFALSLRNEGGRIDLTEASTQERVFAPDLLERKAYYERMESAQTGRGTLEMARDLEQWRLDPKKLAHGLARYIQGDCAENLIVVFDNVDRREAAAQLQAFQTALWFMEQTRALVLLQMRDSTFEAFKNEPPLDTYQSGQIFHISPPRFIDVVKRRLELALEDLSKSVPETVTFETSRGARVSYPSSKAADYLRGVYLELFQSSRNSARILEALAGRNVRRALDIFMALISSGHIPEETILAVAQGGTFELPEYRILRAIMRQDYRFFHDGSGFVANVFFAQSQWERPSLLLTPEILFYLTSQRRVGGDNGQLGFVALPRLQLEMEMLGFVRGDVVSSVGYLVKHGLVEADSSVVDLVREGDCFKTTASGWAHLRLLSARIEYVASVLPTTPTDDVSLRSNIFDAMQTEMRTGFNSLSRMIALSEQFLRYLRRQDQEQRRHPGYRQLRPFGSTYIIEKVASAIAYAKRDTVPIQPDLLDG